METIPCPGCSTALEPSATVCPVCLRPRGKIEIVRAYARLRQEKKDRRRRPFVVAGWLLAAGAASGLVYRFHEPLAAAFAAARARGGRFLDESLASAVPVVDRPAPPPASSPAPAAPPPAAAVVPHPPQSAPAPIPASPAKAEPRPARVDDLPLPAIDADSQWMFYGRVYDLITLLPVANAQLGFATSAGGIAGYTRSDADGRFAAVLGRLAEGGYEVRVTRDGYAPAALYEPDIPYARLSLDKRQELARGARDGEIPPPSLTDAAGENSLRRDVFLAPNR